MLDECMIIIMMIYTDRDTEIIIMKIFLYERWQWYPWMYYNYFTEYLDDSINIIIFYYPVSGEILKIDCDGYRLYYICRILLLLMRIQWMKLLTIKANEWQEMWPRKMAKE